MCLILATKDYKGGALSILTKNQDKEKLKDNSRWRQGKERGYSAGNSGLATIEIESSNYSFSLSRSTRQGALNGLLRDSMGPVL